MSAPDSVAGAPGTDAPRATPARPATVPLFGSEPPVGAPSPQAARPQRASGEESLGPRPQGTRWAVAVGLALLVAAIYAQVRHFGFVSLDDPTYVAQNRHVLEGLNPKTVKWCFSGTFFSNYAPLTLLSYLVDAEAWRANASGQFLEPRGFHLTNAILHGLNVVLLFLGLDAVTGRRGPSALAAALFAVHPVHAETVCWISDRKDLLATTFGLLAIGAYARIRRTTLVGGLLPVFVAASLGFQWYVRAAFEPALRRLRWRFVRLILDLFPRDVPQTDPPGAFEVLVLCFFCGTGIAIWLFGAIGGVGAFVLSLVFYASSLLCKQMLVTLPAALLLLDVWPLRRPFAEPPPEKESFFLHGDASEYDLQSPLPPWGWRLVEKIPFVVLAAAGTFAMFAAQGSSGAIQIERAHPLWSRLAGTVLAYGTYLRKLVWPSDLCCYYPHPGVDIPLGPTIVSGFVLVALSVLAWRFRRAAPWGIVGWCWFLGTLVPVVGLVQVGDQLLADRYVYVSAWGVYVAAAWGLEAAARAARPRIGLALRASGWIAVAVLALVAFRQAGTWRNSISLYEHALSVDPHVGLAHANLAVEYQYLASDEARHAAAATEAGDETAAAEHRAKSDGFLEQAIAHNEAVLEDRSANPSRQAMVVYNLGTIESFRGDVAAAERYYRRALELDDEYVNAWANLGASLILQERYEEARPCLERALQLEKTNPYAQRMLEELIRVRGERPPR